MNAPRVSEISRRSFLRRAAFAAAALPAGLRAETVTLPFENGERELVKYPQKRALIRLTSRPPQLETPFAIFNEGAITPNDAFFVRYHLAGSPPARELLTADAFRVQVLGKVKTPLKLSVAELHAQFEQVEVIAVNQCSGNSRGFFQPRVSGGQSANGAMGNAKWKGVRLKDVLEKAGLAADAKQVLFNGLDTPPAPKVPDFVKALDVEQALDPDILLAYEMNGEPLPWLNGFPLRLVVPGHYGTYWVKHLHEITVVDETFKGFWMDPAYRIPDTECAAIEPGTVPKKTVPISRFNVRSFITNIADGAKFKAGMHQIVKGIAFDGGHGIREVLFSEDDGHTWRAAELGNDLGKFSFREWTLAFTPTTNGEHKLRVKATNTLGQSQPLEPLWNPAGYMRNVVETVTVTVQKA
ncbi:MAG: molybdopterin-dependent oxidoreductase [Chthoniobacteraceae bacterium]